MPDTNWSDLSRLEQRILIKLFGGGSVRNEAAAAIAGLRLRGLIGDELTPIGRDLVERAYRFQQHLLHKSAA